MNSDKITIKVPRLKRRAGVMPTRKEVDKAKKHPQQDKHKKRPILPIDLISQ